MHSLLLFGAGDAALAATRTLVSGGPAIVTSPPPAKAPFALQAETWLALSLMVQEARRRAGPAAEIAAVTAFADRALPDAWSAFVAAAEAWESDVRGGARMLAEDIVSYAKDLTPELHRRLAVLLGPLRARAPSLEEAKACGALLDTLRRGAEERARRAEATGVAIAPFLEAASRLGEVHAGGERNPPVRIVMPHVPGMCLAYGDDGQACISDMKLADRRQYWVLEPSGEAYVLISAADPDRVLVVDQDEGLIPMTREPPPFTFVEHGPRPRVEARDNAPPDACRFARPAYSERQLSNLDAGLPRRGRLAPWRAGDQLSQDRRGVAAMVVLAAVALPAGVDVPRRCRPGGEMGAASRRAPASAGRLDSRRRGPGRRRRPGPPVRGAATTVRHGRLDGRRP